MNALDTETSCCYSGMSGTYAIIKISSLLVFSSLFRLFDSHTQTFFSRSESDQLLKFFGAGVRARAFLFRQQRLRQISAADHDVEMCGAVIVGIVSVDFFFDPVSTTSLTFFSAIGSSKFCCTQEMAMPLIWPMLGWMIKVVLLRHSSLRDSLFINSWSGTNRH